MQQCVVLWHALLLGCMRPVHVVLLCDYFACNRSLLGWYAVTKEHRALLFVFGVLAVLKFVYVAYNLYELWVHPNSITVAVTYTQYAVVGTCCYVLRFFS